MVGFWVCCCCLHASACVACSFPHVLPHYMCSPGPGCAPGRRRREKAGRVRRGPWRRARRPSTQDEANGAGGGCTQKFGLGWRAGNPAPRAKPKRPCCVAHPEARALLRASAGYFRGARTARAGTLAPIIQSGWSPSPGPGSCGYIHIPTPRARGGTVEGGREGEDGEGNAAERDAAETVVRGCVTRKQNSNPVTTRQERASPARARASSPPARRWVVVVVQTRQPSAEAHADRHAAARRGSSDDGTASRDGRGSRSNRPRASPTRGFCSLTRPGAGVV